MPWVSKTSAIFGVVTAILAMPSVALAQVYVTTSPPEELPAPVYNGSYYQPQDLPAPIFNGGYSQPQELPPPVYNGDYDQQEQLPSPVYNGSFFQPTDISPPSYNGGYNEPLQFLAPTFNNQSYAVPAGEYGSTVFDPMSGQYLDNTPVDDPTENAYRAEASRIQSGQITFTNEQPQSFFEYEQVQPAQSTFTFAPSYSPPSSSNYTYQSQTYNGYSPPTQTYVAAQPTSFGDYARACWEGPSGCIQGATAAYSGYKGATSNSLFQGLNVVAGTLGAAAALAALPEAGVAAGAYGTYKFIKGVWGAASSADTLSERYRQR
jgi:hypothetical protein